VREKENQPFQLCFSPFLKVDFQGSRVSFDGALLLMRKLDERSELSSLIASPSRRDGRTVCGLNKNEIRLLKYSRFHPRLRPPSQPAWQLCSHRTIVSSKGRVKSVCCNDRCFFSAILSVAPTCPTLGPTCNPPAAGQIVRENALSGNPSSDSVRERMAP